MVPAISCLGSVDLFLPMITAGRLFEFLFHSPNLQCFATCTGTHHPKKKSTTLSSLWPRRQNKKFKKNLAILLTWPLLGMVSENVSLQNGWLVGDLGDQRGHGLKSPGWQVFGGGIFWMSLGAPGVTPFEQTSVLSGMVRISRWDDRKLEVKCPVSQMEDRTVKNLAKWYI